MKLPLSLSLSLTLLLALLLSACSQPVTKPAPLTTGSAQGIQEERPPKVDSQQETESDKGKFEWFLDPDDPDHYELFMGSDFSIYGYENLELYDDLTWDMYEIIADLLREYGVDPGPWLDGRGESDGYFYTFADDSESVPSVDPSYYAQLKIDGYGNLVKKDGSGPAMQKAIDEMYAFMKAIQTPDDTEYSLYQKYCDTYGVDMTEYQQAMMGGTDQ